MNDTKAEGAAAPCSWQAVFADDRVDCALERGHAGSHSYQPVPDIPEHEHSYLVQPRDEQGRPQDRDHCRQCGKPRGRAVAVDEAYLRGVLRDALAFAQALANSGDPQAPESVARYETALLLLADAPEADLPEDVARLRSGAETLGRVVVHMSRSMEAARIDMLQNGPKAGMQWILAAVPDVNDNPADLQWDGRETASEWLDRTGERAKEATR